ncbi:hypothetical protein BBF96_01705 [Anoxybacter fermentans]|uniref:Xylose isomerase-like TIM barrel domain-containing protein n=1 Tax=Anoxybacter fermentans TaxID=1323375 RepID=A0A3Q9HNV0_9FIRM|nr:cobamide remodeling phosphodiesterase CbiR [Anoxybacter fermentans]AZR72222.1 hypothetical protein BBF96_01705 [Anoxybacter fermentans]
MGDYPFLLGATSLTEPTLDAVGNIELNYKLGIKTVEITLEFPRTLPVNRTLKDAMINYKEQYGVEFTIHLPLSLRMTDVNPYIRDASLKTLEEIFKEMENIKPKAYVLHVAPFFLTGGTPLGRPFEVQLHEDRLEAARETLFRLTNLIEPRMVAIENLFHDLIFLDELIKEFDYSVCMDVGHLLLNNSDLYLFYQKYHDRIKVIHLHDVVNGRDHQQLGEADSNLDLKALFYLLKKNNYQETIILEQFKSEHIQQSMTVVAEVWQYLTK